MGPPTPKATPAEVIKDKTEERKAKYEAVQEPPPIKPSKAPAMPTKAPATPTKTP